MLEQDGLALGAVRELVRACEIALDVLLVCCPLFSLDASIIGLKSW
jgi:hypothetical protein